jgi:hypothetical protein
VCAQSTLRLASHIACHARTYGDCTVVYWYTPDFGCYAWTHSDTTRRGTRAVHGHAHPEYGRYVLTLTQPCQGEATHSPEQIFPFINFVFGCTLRLATPSSLSSKFVRLAWAHPPSGTSFLESQDSPALDLFHPCSTCQSPRHHLYSSYHPAVSPQFLVLGSGSRDSWFMTRELLTHQTKKKEKKVLRPVLQVFLIRIWLLVTLYDTAYCCTTVSDRKISQGAAASGMNIVL